MNVLLVDEDDDFRKRFGAYLAENLNGIMLTSISSLEERQGGIHCAEEADVILMDADVTGIDGLKKNGLAGRVVLLDSGEEKGPSVRSDGIRCVFKYQKASSIISSVAELSDAAVAVPAVRSEGKAEVICVTGFPGGCGRTSFVMMCARFLRRSKSRSSVILPVERYGNSNDYFHHVEMKSDLNLMLLNFASGFRLAPQRFIVEDEYGVSAFVMPGTACDITDLSQDEAGRLLDTIAGWGFFDTIILDVDPQVDPVSRAFARLADRVFVLHDQRRGVHQSEQAWLSHLDSVCGVELQHVMNMVSADGLNSGIFLEDEDHLALDLDVICRIPYDPGSFFMKEGAADISMSGGFARAVAAVVERI